jgi:7 transmembrane receptor (rhodopsin family)
MGMIFSLPFLVFAVYDSSFNPTDSIHNVSLSNFVTVCQVNADSGTARAYITWFMIVLIFIPFFVLIFIYARIVIELARHRSIRLSTIGQSPQSLYDDESNSCNSPYTTHHQQSHSFLAYQRIEQKRLNTVIICLITVAFFACQFPVRIIQLIEMYKRVRNEATMPHLAWLWLWKLSKLLFFLNFTANPVRE